MSEPLTLLHSQPLRVCSLNCCYSALCKVFDSIIIKRYYDQLMSNDLQFSLKAKHSTVMCTATLKEIASHYNDEGSQVFMCMLDATKAFDNVDFVRLFELLMRRDIPGVFLRLILNLYTRQRLKTAWNGAISLLGERQEAQILKFNAPPPPLHSLSCPSYSKFSQLSYEPGCSHILWCRKCATWLWNKYVLIFSKTLFYTHIQRHTAAAGTKCYKTM